MTTPSRQISILESQLASERDKADFNDREHQRLIRLHWDLLDEVEEWRRDALEAAARKVLELI